VKRKIFRVLFALVLVLSFSLVTAVPASAQSSYYVATDGSDAFGDGTQTWVDTDASGGWSSGDTGPWLTISYAINQAVNTDTINVAAGTYAESLTVNKEISLIGTGPTTIIDPALDADGITITADNVVIKDLKVSTEDTAGTVDPPSIAICIKGTNGVEINTVTVETTGDGAMGIWMGETASSNLSILDCQVTINNLGTAIYGGDISPAHSNWTIVGNTLSAANVPGVNLELYDVDTVLVDGNTFQTTGSVNLVYSSEDAVVGGATITNNVFEGSGNIANVTPTLWVESDFITGDAGTSVVGVAITGNTFSNWANAAIKIGEGVAAYDNVSNVTINSNTFNMTTTDPAILDHTGNAIGTGNIFNVSSPATIQGAIDDAFSGDNINVAAGTYTEDLAIPAGKDNLDLKPATGASVTIKGVAMTLSTLFPLAAPNIEILSDGVKIHGFTIQGPDPVSGSYSSGIVIGGANVEIYDNAFEVTNASTTDDVSQAIQTYHETAMPGVDISGLSIHDNTFTNHGTGTAGYEAIYINRDAGTGTVTIMDNQFTGDVLRAITTERSKTTISGNSIITDLAPGLPGGYIGILVRDYNAGAQDTVAVTGNTVKGSGSGKGFQVGIQIGKSGQTLTNISVTNNTVQMNLTGIKVLSSAAGVVVNYNDISGNTNYGVENTDTNTLDATNNWWGDASGPYHPTTNPGGTGEAVSDNVDYDPWLTLPYGQVATDTGTGIASFSTSEGIIEDLTAVDEYTLPFSGKPYLVFPHGFFSFNITGITPSTAVTVTITLPSPVPIGTQYWKYHASEGGWIQIPMGSNDGDNIITITLVDGGLGDDDGAANGVIDDPGGPGVRPPPRPGGGGGGGIPSAPSEPGVTGISDVITDQGVFTETTTIACADCNIVLTIDEGTTGLTAEGEPISEISITEMEDPPALPPDCCAIGLICSIGPSGAIFIPPIDLSFTYDPALIPEGVSEENLVIAFWDGEKWVNLECSVDPATNTMTAYIGHLTPFVVLAYTGAPVFVASELSISPAEVNVGEEVTITVLVTNTGDLEGTYQVTLKINDVAVDTEEVTLAGHASQWIAFTTTKDVAGTYEVAVDDASGTFEVTAPILAPAAFTTSALFITPAEIEAGKEAAISVLVTNTGDLEGTYQVTLKINDVAVDTKEITLAGHASQRVTFTTTKEVPGIYSVAVDGLSGTFEVTAPAKTTSWWVIGGIIAAVVVAIVVPVALRRRRRALI